MFSLLSISLFDTIQMFNVFVMAKYIYIKWSILVKMLQKKIKAPTQAFSETK